jgi:hypothetical protein
MDLQLVAKVVSASLRNSSDQARGGINEVSRSSISLAAGTADENAELLDLQQRVSQQGIVFEI